MKASVNFKFSSFASRHNSSELDSALDLASVAPKRTSSLEELRLVAHQPKFDEVKIASLSSRQSVAPRDLALGLRINSVRLSEIFRYAQNDTIAVVVIVKRYFV